MIKVYHGLFFTTVNQFFPIKCDINIPSELMPCLFWSYCNQKQLLWIHIKKINSKVSKGKVLIKICLQQKLMNITQPTLRIYVN